MFVGLLYVCMCLGTEITVFLDCINTFLEIMPTFLKNLNSNPKLVTQFPKLPIFRSKLSSRPNNNKKMILPQHPFFGLGQAVSVSYKNRRTDYCNCNTSFFMENGKHTEIISVCDSILCISFYYSSIV